MYKYIQKGLTNLACKRPCNRRAERGLMYRRASLRCRGLSPGAYSFPAAQPTKRVDPCGQDAGRGNGSETLVIELGLNDNRNGRKQATPAPDEALEVALQDLESSEPRLPVAPVISGPAVAAPGPPDTPESADSSPPEEVPEAVAYWLARYSRDQAEAARSIRDLAARAPELTARTLLERFEAHTCGPASGFVAGLLGVSAAAVEKLCDPSATLEGSIQLAQALFEAQPRFDGQFAKNLLTDERLGEEGLQRGLIILEKLGCCRRLIPILIQFLRNPNSRVRARAALVLGRAAPTTTLMHRIMRDEDARVRASFVEGLWSSSVSHSEMFLRALSDPNQRVAGNALVGLHRAGHSREVIHHVARMVRHTDAAFRATAAWVMGQTGEQRYAKVLEQMLTDREPAVRRNADKSLQLIQTAGAGLPPPAPVATDRARG